MIKKLVKMVLYIYLEILYENWTNSEIRKNILNQISDVF